MATSAIGPGFLTQTTIFTQQLMASFGFVILISILLDICAQLNTWRILSVSEMRAQDLLNQLLPGLGYFIAALIVLGGLAFNIGNIAGCGLGLNVLIGINITEAAIISCFIALLIFWMKEAGKALDLFAKILGLIMILLTLYIAVSSHPPLAEALKRSVLPQKTSMTAIITLVGGTVGGYITFAGAHRLLDAGIKGEENLKEVDRSAISGIIITGTMRIILFLAALGVIAGGAMLDTSNPPASVFKISAGEIGYRFFGVVMWSASITSVVGASYTSVSFLKTFHPFIEKNQRWIISFFIVLSTFLFVAIGKPVQLLIAAGAVNGVILPVALACMLVASRQSVLMHHYKHPLWMQIAGWLVVVIMSWMSALAILELLF
jgi:Mn2+/Fe2+ NRAMP family transporter